MSMVAHELSDYDDTKTQTPRVKKRMQVESKKKLAPKNPKSKKVMSKNRGKSQSVKKKRTNVNDLYDDMEAKFSVMERADRVVSNLSDELPFFLKCMLPSNVAHGFWLHLPRSFCKKHLPGHDTTVVLVDELGDEYQTSYLLGRHGLSAGWRRFSISHRLVKGDILVFRLLEACKFEVHIVRVHDIDVIEAAICLMNLDASGRSAANNELAKKGYKKSKKVKNSDEPSLFEVPRLHKSVEKKGKRICLVPPPDKSGNASNSFGSEVLEGSEIMNHPRSKDVCRLTTFLHDHPKEVAVCR